jgi:hypothetical protein
MLKGLHQEGAAAQGWLRPSSVLHSFAMAGVGLVGEQLGREYAGIANVQMKATVCWGAASDHVCGGVSVSLRVVCCGRWIFPGLSLYGLVRSTWEYYQPVLGLNQFLITWIESACNLFRLLLLVAPLPA